MRAELVAVGSELLRFGRRDGNGDWLVERLQRLGIEVVARSMVDDHIARIAARVRLALDEAELVVVGGGLGPTEDDRTRAALALLWGVPLERDPEMEARLREGYARAGFPFGGEQARQADRPRGAVWLPNPLGAAPGLWLARERRTVVALPGVPAELRAMWDAAVAPRLAAAAGDAIALRVLHVAGRTESAVDRALAELYDQTSGLDVTLLAGGGGVDVCLRAAGGAAVARIGTLEQEVRRRLGAAVWGADDETLAEVVGRGLVATGRSVAVAESCTGGGLGQALTAVPGSSAWFRGGLVVYADELKVTLAGVEPALLAAHGAVSEATARALARGARALPGRHRRRDHRHRGTRRGECGEAGGARAPRARRRHGRGLAAPRAPRRSRPRPRSRRPRRARSAAASRATMRLFLAVALPQAVRDLLAELHQRLAPDCPGWRFLDAETVHLTLRFLGHVVPALDAACRERWRAAAAECAPFELRLGSLGSFPRGRRPRMLWLDLDEPRGEPWLPLLAAATERAAREAGFTPQTRAFRGHLTLARAIRGARPGPPPTDVAPVLAGFRVDELILYRSHLSPAGARYTALASWPLSGRPRKGAKDDDHR